MQMSRKSAHFGPSFEDESHEGNCVLVILSMSFKRHLWRFIANMLIFLQMQIN